MNKVIFSIRVWCDRFIQPTCTFESYFIPMADGKIFCIILLKIYCAKNNIIMDPSNLTYHYYIWQILQPIFSSKWELTITVSGYLQHCVRVRTESSKLNWWESEDNLEPTWSILYVYWDYTCSRSAGIYHVYLKWKSWIP